MVNVYRVEAKVARDGTLYLENLPFQQGDEVEVIVRAIRKAQTGQDYPLRGKSVRYIEPFKSVDQDEWQTNSKAAKSMGVRSLRANNRLTSKR